MILEITNHELVVGDIEITAVASSSLVQIGDVETIQLASIFDTPAESLVIGPFVPIVPGG